MIVGILLMCIMMTGVPAAVGTLFLPLKQRGEKLLFCWISGQMLLWAGFQCISVPVIIWQQGTFRQVLDLFLGYTLLLMLSAFVVNVVRMIWGQADSVFLTGRGNCGKKSHGEVFLWITFAVMLLVSLFLLCFLAYEEGDDAFYVAVTTMSRGDELLYTKLPYTGGTSGLDARHSLAPFPVWVAVLAWISGLSGAATAHVAVPLMLVPMTYGLYYLIGEKLLEKVSADHGWVKPLYLCIVSLLIVFGGYSTYSAENFLLVRSAQGKSVLANLVVPFLLYLLFMLLENLDTDKKIRISFWVISAAVMVTGCLCSTLGSFLLCMLLGVTVLCGLFLYKKWWLIPYAVLCMAVPFVCAVLYLVI